MEEYNPYAMDCDREEIMFDILLSDPSSPFYALDRFNPQNSIDRFAQDRQQKYIPIDEILAGSGLNGAWFEI